MSQHWRAGQRHTDTDRRQNCAHMQKHADMYAYANLQGQANMSLNMQSAHTNFRVPLKGAAMLMQLQWDQRSFTLRCMCSFHLLICEGGKYSASPSASSFAITLSLRGFENFENTLSECILQDRHWHYLLTVESVSPNRFPRLSRHSCSCLVSLLLKVSWLFWCSALHSQFH